MFWKLTSLSASSPVESVLDKENFTLEELLDEEEIIQECKALNSRLINFLRDRAQVEKLLHYIVEEAPEDADSNLSFKFPFIACEIFTCEIDVILRTLVEEDELMTLFFSFLDPNRPHTALLAGYFSKVVICLMLRKTVPLLNYVQAHPDVLYKLVDLIGVTSIMEVLVRLVGADDQFYPNSLDVMRWLADSSLLEMIVDKLSPSAPPEVHANAAETLCAITRSAPSALATKLSSQSFVSRIFTHALEESSSSSGLVHCLSVCISLLDPKLSYSSPLPRSQHIYESSTPVNSETVNAMLPKLGELLKLLNVSSDEKVLPTTYGELRPPLGKHRLKIVEFIAILLKTGNDVAENELINSGTIRRVLDLFFEYPFNNALHHHAESIIYSCLESKNITLVNHLFEDCDLIGKILETDKNPSNYSNLKQPTLNATGRKAPRGGNIGHITRICNKLVHLGSNNNLIQAFLQGNCEWDDWQCTVLHERNNVENVHRWACGRPTAFQDRTKDSDEDDMHDRDYDVTDLANNLSQAFRYNVYDNEDAEEGNGDLDHDNEDVYLDDESAEVVISSLRLGDNWGSFSANSNWFAFQDNNGMTDSHVGTMDSEIMEEVNLEDKSGNENNSSSDDDEVVVREVDDEVVVREVDDDDDDDDEVVVREVDDDEVVVREVDDDDDDDDEVVREDENSEGFVQELEAPSGSSGGDTSSSFHNDIDKESVGDLSDMLDEIKSQDVVTSSSNMPNGTLIVADSGQTVADLSKVEDKKAIIEEQADALKEEEGMIVDEAASSLKMNIDNPPDNNDSKEFNDANYWKVDQEVAVIE